MWQGIWKSFGLAFEMIFEGNKLLGEIISTTLLMTVQSSLYSFIIGVPIGMLIAVNNFRGKRIIVTIQRTLMGLPAVAVGILVYMLFSGVGPFGGLGLMYSIPLMVLSQVLLITPVVAGMTETAVTPIYEKMQDTVYGLNIRGGRKLLLAANESRYQLIAVYLFAFARSMSEVGAVQIVGGNILHKTRVMTTTIMMNYNMGQFELALALGIILMLIVLALNVVGTLLNRRRV